LIGIAIMLKAQWGPKTRIQANHRPKIISRWLLKPRLKRWNYLLNLTDTQAPGSKSLQYHTMVSLRQPYDPDGTDLTLRCTSLSKTASVIKLLRQPRTPFFLNHPFLPFAGISAVQIMLTWHWSHWMSWNLKCLPIAEHKTCFFPAFSQQYYPLIKLT